MFLAPIIVMFIFHQRWQKYLTIVLIVILFVVSLPIFLTNGSSISSVYVSPEDCAAGEFLNTRFGEGSGMTVYSNYCYGGDIAWYYMPRANGKGPLEYSFIKDKTDLVLHMEEVVRDFENSEGNRIFIYSERRALGWYQTFGIKPDNRSLELIKTYLAGENKENLIFSNDYIHVYVPSSSYY
jgi:hypothetical protein